jgi:soluble lytic murein transglycosylase-like protein
VNRLLLGLVILAAATANAQHFSASDVPGTGVRQNGKVTISNNGRAITAYHFFGNIREAIFSIRSTRLLHFTPYGPAVFDGNASAPALPSAYLSSLVADAGKTHGVDPRLVAAVASRESNYDAKAVSRTGACGIMQLMPETARFLGVTNVFDPRENILGGTRYLRTLLDTFKGDLDLTLAAYNAGPGTVEKYGGIPPYAETRAYVKAVRTAYERQTRN